MPATAEGSWDAVAGLIERPPAPGTVVVIDDLDTLAARLPHDHAHELVERLERIFRGAGESGILVVASAQRLTGATARLADLLPRRAVLPTSSRADHFAAGGDPAHFAPTAPPGRGRFDGVSVQLRSWCRGSCARCAATRGRWSPLARSPGSSRDAHPPRAMH